MVRMTKLKKVGDMLSIALLCLQLLFARAGICPNDCNGHGVCDVVALQCRCVEGYIGAADCSQSKFGVYFLVAHILMVMHFQGNARMILHGWTSLTTLQWHMRHLSAQTKAYVTVNR